MAEAGLAPDVVHTSLQTRAIRTANLALDAMGLLWLPVKRHWRLNERHYGDLTGRDKAEATAEFGDDQVKIWRRSYDIPPPPTSAGNQFDPNTDARYADLPRRRAAPSECLADVVDRMLPYWFDGIVPDLAGGRHRPGGRPRQQPAGAGEAPRRDQRRRHRRASTSPPASRSCTSSTTTPGHRGQAVRWSGRSATPRPSRRRPPRWRTRHRPPANEDEPDDPAVPLHDRPDRGGLPGTGDRGSVHSRRHGIVWQVTWRHLAEISLFSALSKRDLQRIAKASNEVTRPARPVLVDQGDAGREAFVIIDGTATVKRNGRKVGTLGPGDSVGELSLLDHGPRTATVTADTDVTVLVLSAREFAGVLEEVPGLAQKLLGQLAGQVRELDRQIYG